ncbi:hypothetical protein K0U83_03285 [bacterium]|nr:hypothetical protein [bacterium]
MDPVTLTVIAVLASLGVGFGAGWGLKPNQTQKTLEAQAETIEEIAEGQVAILDAAQKPVVIDAEIKAELAEVPVQCRKALGGSPSSVECQWATCLQYGQSSANRPECSAISSLLVETMKANTSPRSE